MSEFQNLRGRLPDHITQGDVKKILRAILSNDAPWDWFTRARIPFPFAVRILRELQDSGYIHYEGDTTKLTERGSSLANELRVSGAPNMTDPHCAGSGLIWEPLRDVYEKFLPLYEARPRNENPEYDQGAMTPESFFRRLALMIHQGDIQGNRIVNLGDDDFASIAIGLTGLAESITVLEIDERIGEYIAKVAADNHLPITVVNQDLTKHLPREPIGTFDTYVCDPPETEAGLLLLGGKGLVPLASGRRARRVFRRNRYGSVVIQMGALAKAAHQPSRGRIHSHPSAVHRIRPLARRKTACRHSAPRHLGGTPVVSVCVLSSRNLARLSTRARF